jgi:hypothetical protein
MSCAPRLNIEVRVTGWRGASGSGFRVCVLKNLIEAAYNLLEFTGLSITNGGHKACEATYE